MNLQILSLNIAIHFLGWIVSIVKNVFPLKMNASSFSTKYFKLNERITDMKRIVFTSAMLILLVCASGSYSQPSKKIAMSCASFLSLNAKLGKLEPFYGLGLSYQISKWQINGFVFWGKAFFKKFGDWTGVDTKFNSNDVLYGGTIDYLIFSPTRSGRGGRIPFGGYRGSYHSSGFMLGIGGGYIFEKVTAEQDVSFDWGYGQPFSNHTKEQASAGSSLIEGLVGYKAGRLIFYSKYLYLFTSDNVSEAFIVGLGLRF